MTDNNDHKSKLGEWKIERSGGTKLIVTLPEGMEITGDDVSIEDILTAIANYHAIQSGRVVAKCCGGNVAIAVAPN